MSTIKIINVAGARPNFMKIAPLMRAMRERPGLVPMLIHTGQHYDESMSKLFFDELGIPAPDLNLEVGSASHAAQTAAIMERFEPVLLRERPDLVIVVGDVNSTIACALTAVKLGIPVAHVEAGLRSFDRAMPEEINRLLTDAIADLLFITERSANENLLREGIAKEKIHFVGNVMIDTLLCHRARAEQSDIHQRLGLLHASNLERRTSNLEPGAGNPEPRTSNLEPGTSNVERRTPIPYALVTLHRPSNVDATETLHGILDGLNEIAERLPVIFPCHPRTRNRLEGKGERGMAPGLRLCDPFGYLDFLKLMAGARIVLTDSGGIQEETTILGIPCLTLRANTERPVTVTEGTNQVIGNERQAIVKHAFAVLDGPPIRGRIPERWDGKAAERIVDIIERTVC